MKDKIFPPGFLLCNVIALVMIGIMVCLSAWFLWFKADDTSPARTMYMQAMAEQDPTIAATVADTILRMSLPLLSSDTGYEQVTDFKGRLMGVDKSRDDQADQYNAIAADIVLAAVYSEPHDDFERRMHTERERLISGLCLAQMNVTTHEKNLQAPGSREEAKQAYAVLVAARKRRDAFLQKCNEPYPPKNAPE